VRGGIDPGIFFTLALDTDEWLASHPGYFTLGKELPVLIIWQEAV